MWFEEIWLLRKSELGSFGSYIAHHLFAALTTFYTPLIIHSQAQATGRSMSRLIFWYGVKFEDRAQAYSFVSENKVISYEQGKLQGYNILPSKIANKIKKRQHLTKIEEQIHRGLMEVELDVTAMKKSRYCSRDCQSLHNFYDMVFDLQFLLQFLLTINRTEANR